MKPLSSVVYRILPYLLIVLLFRQCKKLEEISSKRYQMRQVLFEQEEYLVFTRTLLSDLSLALGPLCVRVRSLMKEMDRVPVEVMRLRVQEVLLDIARFKQEQHLDAFYRSFPVVQPRHQELVSQGSRD